MNNQATLDLINDLIHQLKTRDPNDEIANHLNNSLNHIINIFVLDQDQHIWASLSTNLPPKFHTTPNSTKEYQEFDNLVYQWIPKHPIKLSSFIHRCLHNSDKTFINLTRHIKSSLLALKEDGKIEIDSDDWIRKL